MSRSVSKSTDGTLSVTVYDNPALDDKPIDQLIENNEEANKTLDEMMAEEMRCPKDHSTLQSSTFTTTTSNSTGARNQSIVYRNQSIAQPYHDPPDYIILKSPYVPCPSYIKVCCKECKTTFLTHHFVLGATLQENTVTKWIKTISFWCPGCKDEKMQECEWPVKTIGLDELRASGFI